MMVHTSMDVDIYDVSIHDWAYNVYRIPSCLPSDVYPALSDQVPVPSRLPDRPHAPQDDIQCIHPRESMALAALREKNSFHPQVPPWEEEAECAFVDRINHQNKTQDFPCPNRGLHL
jgi:hypothetical protein